MYSAYLTGRVPVYTHTCTAKTEKCQFGTEKYRFGTEKCQLRTEKCRFSHLHGVLVRAVSKGPYAQAFPVDTPVRFVI